ncbi:MAG: hypothetical protein U9Q66_02625, partial [Patescibacteria group bacterium]|nr:hypothetical protein [Patescibacteria group bacterium]
STINTSFKNKLQLSSSVKLDLQISTDIDQVLTQASILSSIVSSSNISHENSVVQSIFITQNSQYTE